MTVNKVSLFLKKIKIDMKEQPIHIIYTYLYNTHYIYVLYMCVYICAYTYIYTYWFVCMGACICNSLKPSQYKGQGRTSYNSGTWEVEVSSKTALATE